ncbi:cation:proton antiporter [Brevibacillus sp. B_LB10_24]|uniref:cation:proton antiporter n=1 Tax=Brevibacillus sp. B_LB10_24 TaxID=3380645 RepID=UPI0038B7787B
MFTLNGSELTHFLLAMACLLATANFLGYVAERLAIPRVIGEVAAGLVLGPTFLGSVFFDRFNWLFLGFSAEDKLFGLVCQIGLMMLLFTSGLKFQTQFNNHDLKIVAAIVVGSTVLPFAIGWISTSVFPVTAYLGPANNLFAFKIVVAISIAVTSIPVISKIFHDLGIMHSRFAKLIVVIAGIHDVLLWAALGIATSVAGQGGEATVGTISQSLAVTAAFIVGFLLAATFLLKRTTSLKTNVLFRSSPLGFVLLILFGTVAAAGYLGVDTIFGALLAGIAVKWSLPQKLLQRIEHSVGHMSYSWFIPVYFATVGLQLDLAHQFDVFFFVKYLAFATAAQAIIVYATSRMIRLDRLSSMNFALAMNARGGPGIVLSTIAYSVGIVNQEFFAVLVMLSLATSWLAGSWLRFVLNKGWRLMPGDEYLSPERPNDYVADPTKSL